MRACTVVLTAALLLPTVSFAAAQNTVPESLPSVNIIPPNGHPLSDNDLRRIRESAMVCHKLVVAASPSLSKVIAAGGPLARYTSTVIDITCISEAVRQNEYWLRTDY